MISRDPPPRLADRDRWSLTFHDFVAQCLQKVFSQTWLPCEGIQMHHDQLGDYQLCTGHKNQTQVV